MGRAKKRKAVVDELIDRWRGRMNVRQYRIEWKWVEGSDVLGSCWRADNERRVKLSIERWLAWDGLRDTIAHEMLHTLHCGRDHAIRDLEGSAFILQPVFDVWHANYSRQDEIVIDELARILCTLEPWLGEDADLRAQWEKPRHTGGTA